MKLGRIKKGLVILLGIMTACPSAFAQESIVKSYESTTTEITNEKLMEEEEVFEEMGEDEMVALIQKEGTVINQSQTHGNVKVTLESIWADQYNYKMLLSVEHVDKTPFEEGVEIHFNSRQEVLSKEEYEKAQILRNIPEDATAEEAFKIQATIDEWLKQFIKADGSVDMEAYMEALSNQREDEGTYGTGSGSFGEYEMPGTPEYKKYIVMTGSMMEALTDELVVDLGEYSETAWPTYESKLDLAAYLEAHQKDVLKTVPNELDEGELQYLEKLKEAKPEIYEEVYKDALAQLEMEPKYLLKDNGLKLQILEGKEEPYITDIGFIDEMLHINFRGDSTRRDFFILSNGEEEAYSDYSSGMGYEDEAGNRVHEKYITYPIKNIEALKKYQLQMQTEETVLEINEQFTFKVKSKLAEKTTKAMNQKVQLPEENQGLLKSITQTKLSLTLVIEDLVKSPGDHVELTVIFKDGTKQNIYTSATELSKNKAILVYDIVGFRKEMAKVMLGDVELVSYK